MREEILRVLRRGLPLFAVLLAGAMYLDPDPAELGLGVLLGLVGGMLVLLIWRGRLRELRGKGGGKIVIKLRWSGLLVGLAASAAIGAASTELSGAWALFMERFGVSVVVPVVLVAVLATAKLEVVEVDDSQA